MSYRLAATRVRSRVELGVVQGVVGGLAITDLLVEVGLHGLDLQDAVGIILKDRSPPVDLS